MSEDEKSVATDSEVTERENNVNRFVFDQYMMITGLFTFVFNIYSS